MASEPARGRVVIVEEGRVALIERVRGGRRYFLFPGGGVEGDESPAEAAVREAREELGVEVALEGLLYAETFAGTELSYFGARIEGGTFGTGAWPDHDGRDELDRLRAGSYRAVWLPLAQLLGHDVRPPALARRLAREETAS